MTTKVQELADFVTSSRFQDLSEEAVAALKIRVLDSVGCAIGALAGKPMKMLRAHLEDFNGSQHATLIGGGRSAPDRAALYNSGLVRYLDFNDSYLAEGETCHPSDNLGAVLAAAEYAQADGRTLLTSLAVAYQVQCRLSDEAPVRAKGFDHTTQGSYAAAAGVARALGLPPDQTANAIAISGTALNALRVTRTGELSHWKGLAYPHTAFAATHATFLAMRGITGPPEVFEGNKGFMESIAGKFHLDWSNENLERVRRTIIKKYNAEIHSQSATEGLLELQSEVGFQAEEVESIAIEIFDVAYHIIGGGEEGDKTIVRRKEEADHSLHYIVAVALLDGDVMPPQYAQDRIARLDVQDLLRRVEVSPNPAYSRRFPEEMPCKITVELHDGSIHQIEKVDYEGFTSRPMSWSGAMDKFNRLTEGRLAGGLGSDIPEAIQNLDRIEVRQLTELLAQIPKPN
ncbi:MAG: MmgE/PrpD family protein [Anaerolineales bacterium]